MRFYDGALQLHYCKSPSDMVIIEQVEHVYVSSAQLVMKKMPLLPNLEGVWLAGSCTSADCSGFRKEESSAVVERATEHWM